MQSDITLGYVQLSHQCWLEATINFEIHNMTHAAQCVCVCVYVFLNDACIL